MEEHQSPLQETLMGEVAWPLARKAFVGLLLFTLKKQTGLDYAIANDEALDRQNHT